MDNRANGGLLLGLQYLRFVAALLVVMSHAWQMIPLVGTGGSIVGSDFSGGASGVDMFFVISGFIMVHITHMRPVGPGQFMLERVARISPTYWVITFVMAAVLIVAPSVFRTATLDMATLLTSLLYIPWPSTAIEGTAPLLQIGWTLNYEMFFYAIFAAAMLVSRPNRIALAAAAIMLLVSMQLVYPNKTNDIFQFYSSTIMIEFVFGMVIAVLINRYDINTKVLAAALILALGIWVWSLTFDVGRLSQDRFLIWGLPAAMMVACIAAIDLRTTVPFNRVLLLLGNASYAIYLTHLFPLGAVRKVWPMMPEFIRGHDVLLLLVAISLALVVGVCFFLFIEKPLVKLAKGAVDRLRSERKGALAH